MKTLWLGCSHSCGYYEGNNNNNLIDRRLSMVGLPVTVGREEWEEWKIISAPGFGILEFAVMLSDMDYKDILNFDNIILQLTAEPRLVSLDPDSERLKLEYMRRYIHSDNTERKSPIYRYDSDYTHPFDFKLHFNMHTLSFYELHKNKKWSGSNDKALLLEVAEQLNESLNRNLRPQVQIAYKTITEIIKRRNIKLYTFHWHESKGTYRFLTDFDYMKYDIFNGQGIWDICKSPDERKKMYVESSGHPTKEGVAIGSRMIINALDNAGYGV